MNIYLSKKVSNEQLKLENFSRNTTKVVEGKKRGKFFDGSRCQNFLLTLYQETFPLFAQHQPFYLGRKLIPV